MRIKQALKRAENVETFVDFDRNIIKKSLRVEMPF